MRPEHVEAAVEDTLVTGDAVRVAHVGPGRKECRAHETPHAGVEVDAGGVARIVDLEFEVQLWNGHSSKEVGVGTSIRRVFSKMDNNMISCSRHGT